MIKIFIVDDHKILIDAIENHLESEDDISCIGSATSGEEALKLIPDLNPDVILMDISLPDTNGVELTSKLKKINSDLKVIALSSHMEISIVKKILKNGAMGYVSKSTNIAQLDTAIRKVHLGEKFLDDKISEIYMNSLMGEKRKVSHLSVVPSLTKREKEVLSLISEELTTNEISEKLYISINTVETHRKNLMQKFQVRNSVGLIKKAIELKMIEI